MGRVLILDQPRCTAALPTRCGRATSASRLPAAEKQNLLIIDYRQTLGIERYDKTPSAQSSAANFFCASITGRKIPSS